MLFAGSGLAAGGGSAAGALIGLAVLAALVGVGLAFRRPGLSAAGDAGLEERIERLEDLRWQARGDADYLKALLDAQTDVIIRRDRDGRVLFVNNSFYRLFEVSLSEIRNKPFAPTILDVDRASADAVEEASMSSGRGPGPLPDWAEPSLQRVATAHGPRWFAWQHQRVDLPSSAGWEIQSIGRDVTAAREHEAALADARDQAQTADRAKSRFLASMSHEIRTPMNGILGMTGLLRETRLSAEQSTYADAIYQSATTLLGLIDEILDFSKVEAGRIELRREPVDIIACVQGAVELLAPRAFEKGLDLVWSVSPDLPRKILSDEVRLRQILLNLIGNAIKFTPQGGVSVWLGAEEAADGRAIVKCVIRDTGPGLGEDERARIFLEFERAVPVGTMSEAGTGLGLAIAQRLARGMNGGIEVTSTPGHGSTFSLTLPLEPLTASRCLDVPDHLRGRHVAVFAPAGIERRTVANFLRALDIVVSEFDGTASEPHAGFSAPAAFDFVLFDADLDATRARTIVGQCAPATGASAKSAVITAPGARDAIERFRNNGIAHFLVRPIRPATLLALLDGALGTAPAFPPPMLPRENEAQAIAARRRLPGSLRILVAEDNEINALLSRKILERLGCEVVLATDGQQAIDLVAGALAPDGKRFDAVLMDLNMPGKNGFEASARIAELYGEHNVPAPAIIAVTASAFEEDRANCLDAGMDGYLAKPFEAAALERILAEVLPDTSGLSTDGTPRH